MTAAPIPDLIASLTDEQFDTIRALVTAACVDALAAERDLAIMNAELRRLRRERAAHRFADSWVIGL